jgi:antitoxin component YwqK of YwqJK toxin-antitoxin module
MIKFNKISFSLLLLFFHGILFCQKKIKYGDLEYMVKDTTSVFPVKAHEFLIKKSLPDGIYIAMEKKDTIFVHTLKDHKFEGLQIWYQGRHPYTISFYKNDRIQKKTGYFWTRKKSDEINYIDGIKNGKEINYYDNDTVSLINNYLNDSIKDWRSFYKNGAIKAEGLGFLTYRKGFLIEYYEKGQIKRKIFFINGVPIYFTSFYETGIVKAFGYIDIYEEDVREAYSIGFNKVSKDRYINRNESEVYYFDENGKFIKKEIPR